MTPNLSQLNAKGKSATLELKRSTGDLREALQTLGAFANGKGGRVIIEAKPSGELVGQRMSEQPFTTSRRHASASIRLSSSRSKPSRSHPSEACLSSLWAGSVNRFRSRTMVVHSSASRTRWKMPQECYEALRTSRSLRALY